MHAAVSRLIFVSCVALWSILFLGCSAKTSAPRLYPMGERAEAGQLIYTVLEAEWHTQIGQGENARYPENNFLLLRLSVTNSGSQECTIPPLHLVDARGAMIKELQEGAGVPEWLGLLRRLKPTETSHGRVVFDVPRADYRLRVTDDAFLEEDPKVALIEVPLRFGAAPASSMPPVR